MSRYDTLAEQYKTDETRSNVDYRIEWNSFFFFANCMVLWHVVRMKFQAIHNIINSGRITVTITY